MMGPFYYYVILVVSLQFIKGSPQILFANRKDIRLFESETKRKIDSSKILISHLEDAVALDFYYENETLFWADVGLEEIRSMQINDPKTNRSIVYTGLSSPDGLACDWLGKKLYWTDSETNRIEVSNFDGSHRKVLFWRDLDQPRAIALVPMDGWMFWTDWGETPKIERASMDGNITSRKIIVSENISWPNGITVDYNTKRIYWTDAKLLLIVSMDFDGGSRIVVASENLKHPFALTVYQDMLYWTDWTTRAVHGCNRLDGCDKWTTFGGFLSPMDIQVYHPDRQPKVPTPCDKNNGGCSHLCLLSAYSPFYSCACPTGVLLKADGKTCENGPQELLLLVRRSDIRRISLDTPDYTDVVLELEGIKNAIAVDYDPIEKYIYWTDDVGEIIRRAFINGTCQEDLASNEVFHPDGIAIDWIARNMYWTDTGTDRIEVARLNGTSRKILITERLQEPRAIILDPPDGYMYWTDWGESPKIEKAALDGSQRIVLINSGLGWPNGLSIDYKERKLYWGDAKTDKIEISNLDGSDRRELVSDQLPHIFGFTLLGNYIYWSDWQRRTVERVDKVTGVIREMIIDQLPDLMGLKAINVNDMNGTTPCAINNGNCSHLCLNRPRNNYVCSCPGGLELMLDNMTCIVPEAFLLFSRKENIRRISLQTNREVAIPLSGVQEANALDYDLSDSRIYWTDTSRKAISRAFMNGSNVEIIIEFGLNYPEGMAVDWVAQNLYWTDMGSNRIEVARLNGSSRRVLLWQNMDDPRSLALDPTESYMYWSDWGTSGRIERAAMDGSSRKVIISKMGRSNGLTIDYFERRLYWIDIDALKIESSDLEGNRRLQIIGDNLFDPYGLTQYEDYIYWTDWKTNNIERADKVSGSNRTVVHKNLDHVMDILVYHTSRQSGWNPCALHNGGCTHLCLALPRTAQQKSYAHNCACPTHYSLSPDNKTCHYPKVFILFSQRNSISRFLVDAYDSPDITLPIHGLKNIKALDYDPVDRFVYWIDGRSKSIRKCHVNGHVNGSKVISVVTNQADNIHPFDIAYEPYTRVLFWSCSQHNVINVTTYKGKSIGTVIGDDDDRPRLLALHARKGILFWINMIHPPLIESANLDGSMRKVIIDSDLDRPVALTVDTKDNYLFFGDMGLKKIERSLLNGKERKVIVSSDLLHPISLTVLGQNIYWIDHDQQIIEVANKLTGSDHRSVQARMPLLTKLLAISNVDSEQYFTHACAVNNGGCTHLCILVDNNKRRCGCPLHLVLSSDRSTCVDIPECPNDKFRCISGATCFPISWRCDGITECDDMSDEMNCGICKPHQFRCQNGDCIDSKYKCDGTVHCKDHSDEHCCHNNSFLCSSYECISTSQLCDTKKDCSDGSDESGNKCAAVTSQRQASISPSYTYIIVIAVIFVFGILLFLSCRSKWCHVCKKKIAGKDEDIHDVMLPTKSFNDQFSTMSSCPQRDVAISSFQGSSYRVGLTDSLPISDSSLYDRNHITGASSSSSSRTYPLETLNPPPSPVTVRSQYIHGHVYLGSYKHYRSKIKPPPPTPCSTDVNDDSSNIYSSGMELSYDSEPFIPPPPTPRSPCLSDENFRTIPKYPEYPDPPPPSPVPPSM